MEKLVLIGAGGHCKVVIEIIKSMNAYEIIGITDNSKNVGEIVSGIPVIGNDSVLKNIYLQGVSNAFICVGALKNMKIRQKIYKQLKDIGFKLPVLIHNKAIVSDSSKIYEGTCVMAGAVINAGAEVRENCIINTSSVIEHDCSISMNTHISPRACLCGGVKIGADCHIGAGSTIIQRVVIGENVTIGAGAAVICDIPFDSVAVGVPAKVIRSK